MVKVKGKGKGKGKNCSSLASKEKPSIGCFRVLLPLICREWDQFKVDIFRQICASNMPDFCFSRLWGDRGWLGCNELSK